MLLHLKKIRHMKKYQNFLNDRLVETLLLLCTKNICDDIQRKQRLELDINQKVLVFGVIKPLFDIHITSFILRLHRKKILISGTKKKFINVMLLEMLLLLFTINVYYRMKGIIVYYRTQNKIMNSLNVIKTLFDIDMVNFYWILHWYKIMNEYIIEFFWMILY